MEVTPEILERLDGIIRQSGLSRRQFALSLGNSPSTMTEIFSRRIKNFSGAFLKVLELQYGININWLETGMGRQYCSKIVITHPEEERIIRNYRKLEPHLKEVFLILSETFFLQQAREQPEESLK